MNLTQKERLLIQLEDFESKLFVYDRPTYNKMKDHITHLWKIIPDINNQSLQKAIITLVIFYKSLKVKSN